LAMPSLMRISDLRSKTEISKPSPRRATAGAESGPGLRSGPMVTAKDRDIEEAPAELDIPEKSSG